MKNIQQKNKKSQKNSDTAKMEKVLNKYSALSIEKQALILQILDAQIQKESDAEIKDLLLSFRGLFQK